MVLRMVELKTKLCVAPLCFCGGTIHPHHNSTTTTTLHHHRLPYLRHHSIDRTAASPQQQQQQQQQSKMAVGQGTRIARKYRRSRLKRVKRQEFKKLRDMVPSLQEKPVVTKVEVIEEAIKYIDQLHTALIERFRTRGLPCTLRDLPLEPGEVHGGNIRELVRHLLSSSASAPLTPARLENARTMPSFLQRAAKARRL